MKSRKMFIAVTLYTFDESFTGFYLVSSRGAAAETYLVVFQEFLSVVKAHFPEPSAFLQAVGFVMQGAQSIRIFRFVCLFYFGRFV